MDWLHPPSAGAKRHSFVTRCAMFPNSSRWNQRRWLNEFVSVRFYPVQPRARSIASEPARASSLQPDPRPSPPSDSRIRRRRRRVGAVDRPADVSAGRLGLDGERSDAPTASRASAGRRRWSGPGPSLGGATHQHSRSERQGKSPSCPFRRQPAVGYQMKAKLRTEQSSNHK